MSGPAGTLASRERPVSAGPGALTGFGVLLVFQVAGVVLALGMLREIALHPSLFPLLPLGALAGAALAMRPDWAVPAFAALCAVLIGRRHDAALPIPVAAAAVTLLVLAVREAAGRRQLALRAGAASAMLALPLVAAGLVAVGGATLPGSELADLAFLPLVALALLGVRVEQALVALAAATALLGAGALYSVLLEPTGMFGVVDDRAAGPLGDPGALALVLATLVPISLSLALGQPGWRRSLGIAATLLAGAGILASGSMFGLLVAIGAAYAYLRLSRGTGGRRLLPLGVVLALAALPAVSVSAPGADNTAVSRPSDRSVAIEMVSDRPPLGVGPGRYREAYPDYADVSPGAPEAPREPASLPLRIAAEQGVAGLLGWAGAIVAIVSFTLAGGAARTRAGLAILCALGAYATAALVLGGSHLRLLYVLLGLALAAAWSARSRTASPGPAR